MNDIVTAVVDENFNVHQRLARIRRWQNEYFSEDEQLQVRLGQLDGSKPLGVQRGHQIGQLRKILIMKQMREPLEILIGSDQPEARHRSVRQNLVRQFASLSKMDRLRWLDNFLFIMTPDLLKLHKKILEYCAFDQQCIFLLSAPSGMGKTTYLNWLVALNLPGVEEQTRLAPVVVKVDAPLGNGTLKTLLQRMLLACGATYLKESDLFLVKVNVGTEVIDGPAKLIENWTGGILRDVVRLLRHASRRAIEDDHPCLSPQLLEEAWKEIQTVWVADFF